MVSAWRTIWETKPYIDDIEETALPDEDHAWFISSLARSGPLGQGLGSELYKARIGYPGHGKSRGVRVVYLWPVDEGLPAIMLAAFQKTRQANLTQGQLKAVRQAADQWVAVYRRVLAARRRTKGSQ